MTETNIFFSPEVTAAEQGLRVDKFLSKAFPQLSRSQIQRLLGGGYITCGDITVADNACKTRLGDMYQLELPEAREADPVPENIELDIVYEDEDLLVVNKPAGMTVHPAPGAVSGTLVNALLFHCRESLSGIGGVKRPGIVHRIDKDTSGLLVVAKNDEAHRHLCEQFAEHSIERTYYAAVYGVPVPARGTISGNIGRSVYDRKKMAVVANRGKEAVTHYRLLQNFRNAAALVQCNLETGRTHQIRVHMASRGWNLIGDQLYVKSGKSGIKGFSVEEKKFINYFPRQALHAASLGFRHPRRGDFLQFNVDFPDDFKALLDVLKG